MKRRRNETVDSESLNMTSAVSEMNKASMRTSEKLPAKDPTYKNMIKKNVTDDETSNSDHLKNV